MLTSLRIAIKIGLLSMAIGILMDEPNMALASWLILAFIAIIGLLYIFGISAYSTYQWASWYAQHWYRKFNPIQIVEGEDGLAPMTFVLDAPGKLIESNSLAEIQIAARKQIVSNPHQPMIIGYYNANGDLMVVSRFNGATVWTDELEGGYVC